MAFYLTLPSLVVREIVAFLPAALMIPFAIIEPIKVKVYPFLAVLMFFMYIFLMVATFGS